ncbi:bifunctional 2-polyprenyl-6-hydroxyphenol methylase/3-demethylubiquinol 3-O-methyltransferase UbiG [Massilia sp. BJB1822]|uniref:class I SAM-dependent methyltransferase n=1 Tax=Massilia sp. BJB1822 TaxID=2744470 RepID=UPI0015944750|nr:class I SAM-dependent methyltransferase [Massilia sp. BJB1822]NVD97762.1 class I SAM-dependent methyltransferase [Massilia sp. BJB1822]
MDLTVYRASSSEQQRTADLLRLMPAKGRSALDIGARDGHFSMLMADRFEEVTALDLTHPNIPHPRVRCIKGNAANMQFSDGAFDFVFCAEVLEHIPTAILRKVCQEMARVVSDRILIGVPYKQDIRVGRTTCYSCGKPNPPWGHVNAFDEQRIAMLFPSCALESMSLIGSSTARTNWLSAALMDFAGNPYGTYDQEEACVYCHRRLVKPPPRNPAQLIATKCAFGLRKISELLPRPRGNWMHLVLRKI